MLSPIGGLIARATLSLVVVLALSGVAVAAGWAAEKEPCKIPMKSCAVGGNAEAPSVEREQPGDPKSRTVMPNEELSLYKTISYVTGATLTDQLWYLIIASEAATTGGIFMVVNATTSSMMTYSYEYMWNICCLADPGPDGIVPISATKAIIYRGLSIIRVGALALLFGNTIGSSAVVTTAITVSRTAVYVANDFVWNRVDASQAPDGSATPPELSPELPSGPLASVQPISAEVDSDASDGFFGMKALWKSVFR